MVTTLSPPIIPRPFLKWAGGKGRLIRQYTPNFPKYFRTYYEPFLGGGAIFFHLRPQYSILTDFNPELINVYCCVRDHVDGVISELREHEFNHFQYQQSYYYAIRASEPTEKVQQAARILYLNKTCFNGLYRENSRGKFNVPMGRYKKPRICNPDLLHVASEALQDSQIEAKPFNDILQVADSSHDFVYFDPPYHPISATSSFTAYNRYAFREQDQVRLAHVFRELANRGVRVMLSNSNSPLIHQLYQDFPIHQIKAIRAINSNAQRRGAITELLITSY
ncbi:MAG: DNA adenine methylase [Microcoleaceae cyanobacterium]